MLALAMMAFWGCLQTDVLMSGPITDTLGGGTPVAGADVTARDLTGAVYSETSTDADGWFALSLPVSQLFYLEAGEAAFVTTSFTGVAGSEPLEVQEGQLWLRRAADLEAIREEFVGCAPETLADGSGVLEGEVRLYAAPQQETADLPLVTTAVVTVYTDDGLIYGACYLDDEGVSDPAAELTGQTGRFAVFGVKAGPVSVQVAYDYGASELHEDWYASFVPGGGTVPLYPALVGLP